MTVKRGTRRFLQRVSGIHKIHDIRWAFGYTVPFTKYAYFRDYGFKKVTEFHDCTKTGVY